MAQDLLGYDKLVDTALRGVVRAVLHRAAHDGLAGTHHFYLGFRTVPPASRCRVISRRNSRMR